MVDHRRKLGHKVRPLSGAKIKKIANQFRDAFDLKKAYLKIPQLYEALQSMEFLEFEIVEDAHMSEEARTFPDKSFIEIKESIYNGACEGDGHCRFTLAHELGHLLLHKNQNSKSYARGEVAKHEVFEDSEWQADEFASELLMDSRLISDDMTSNKAAKEFGVSKMAAGYKIYKVNKKK